MVPAALWAALGAGLQLWAIVPSQFVLPTYALEPGNESKGQPRQYYDKRAGTNCTMCPPGYFVENFCTKTTDTVCSLCKDSTYTQIYNWIATCFSCSAPCSFDQIEVRPCTPKQNRVCTCRSGWYCMLTRQEGCRVCAMLRKCPPGFGVAKPGTSTSNVLCAPCTPGTFSDTTSSTDMCRPHRNCSSVAVPGNASMDAVCESPTPSLGVSGNTSTDTACESSPPVLTLGSAPYNITLPVGLIVGVTALAVVIIVLVNCVIMTKRKKKPLCLQGESKVPNLPADKARGVPGPEQQYLLTTAPSSSSSSLESSASAANKRAPPGNQPQAPGREKAGGARETWASCESSEPYPSGHGTQVNVTCVVNVCNSSQHGPQCPSQASSTMGDMDASHSGSPKDEQLPFSKEERPFQSHLGSPEMLQKSSEEKSLPLGVPDAGMKLL